MSSDSSDKTLEEWVNVIREEFPRHRAVREYDALIGTRNRKLTKPRFPTQPVCSECKTHHPNGWACPKELSAARRELAKLEKQFDEEREIMRRTYKKLDTTSRELAEAREEIESARKAGAEEMRETIHIVFDGPPGPRSGRFVEVETPGGIGLRRGEWIDLEGGLWALKIDCALPIDPLPERERLAKCEACNGSGFDDSHGDSCAVCDGSGEVRRFVAPREREPEGDDDDES